MPDDDLDPIPPQGASWFSRPVSRAEVAAHTPPSGWALQHLVETQRAALSDRANNAMRMAGMFEDASVMPVGASFTDQYLLTLYGSNDQIPTLVGTPRTPDSRLTGFRIGASEVQAPEVGDAQSLWDHLDAEWELAA